jgi:hypothetical protein
MMDLSSGAKLPELLPKQLECLGHENDLDTVYKSACSSLSFFAQVGSDD